MVQHSWALKNNSKCVGLLVQHLHLELFLLLFQVGWVVFLRKKNKMMHCLHGPVSGQLIFLAGVFWTKKLILTYFHLKIYIKNSYKLNKLFYLLKKTQINLNKIIKVEKKSFSIPFYFFQHENSKTTKWQSSHKKEYCKTKFSLFFFNKI